MHASAIDTRSFHIHAAAVSLRIGKRSKATQAAFSPCAPGYVRGGTAPLTTAPERRLSCGAAVLSKKSIVMIMSRVGLRDPVVLRLPKRSSKAKRHGIRNSGVQ